MNNDLEFAPVPTDTIMTLSIPDRIKIALWLQGYARIVGINQGRLVQLQDCDSDYLSLRELGFIADECGPHIIRGLIGGAK